MHAAPAPPAMISSSGSLISIPASASANFSALVSRCAPAGSSPINAARADTYDSPVLSIRSRTRRLNVFCFVMTTSHTNPRCPRSPRSGVVTMA